MEKISFWQKNEEKKWFKVTFEQSGNGTDKPASEEEERSVSELQYE